MKRRTQKGTSYAGPNLLQIAMPMGGLGAGGVCLNGHGGLQDFSLRHQPSFTALPDGHIPTEAAFALLHLPDLGVTRLLEGPLPPEKIYDQGLQAQGYRKGGHEGFPRFRKSVFHGQFPFGRVVLSDPKIPLEVELTAFNPFIPRDDKNSGIPCMILEYQFRNASRKPLRMEFSYHLSHLAPGLGLGQRHSRNEVIPHRGVHFFNTEDSRSAVFGSACLMTLNGRPAIKGMWLRGGWFDALSAIWREVSTGKFTANSGSNGVDLEGRNGGSLLFRTTLRPGETAVYPLVIAWHFPNAHFTAGSKDLHGRDGGETLWQPYYAGLWRNAREVAQYVRSHYASLRRRTAAFADALFSSTLPPEILGAISAGLAILKSPTILRQRNGNVWGWEGCFTHSGCCSGTCTHVWNYAQALPHLYPALERTLREQELVRSMNGEGRVAFRATLPDGPADFEFHPAADGQLGGPLKLFRDWQISGDTEWLRGMYPLARCSLEYCIRTWDPDRRGALFEPHHNTYDIEFWGPDGMCTSIYLGALSAMSAMADHLGEKEDAHAYGQLAERSARYMDEKLFNGEYYQQNVQYKDLRDQSFRREIENPDRQSSEVVKLLKKEGPKYQYGSGCLSDGIIGGWMAALYGVPTPLDRGNIRSTLRAIHRHNFRRDLSEHACCQRPGYALGAEGGLLICSWPRGGKPTLPFVYSDEVWTGIEYQVASHLILEGYVKEGLEIVGAARRRYDGHVRNPWNEYECGSYYARAMAGYALLRAYSGFRYSAVTKELWFAPKSQPFTTFFSTAFGHGTIRLRKKDLEISLLEGSLEVKTLHLSQGKTARTLELGKTVTPKRSIVLALR